MPGLKIDAKRARETVQGYTKHRTLTDEEIQHLYDVHKLHILIDAIWFLDRGDAADFYERRKIEYLNALGREGYVEALFS